MKTIAYICSYETNELTAAQDLTGQAAGIKNFCKSHKIELDEIFTETSSRDDFKPVLLNIMSTYFGTIDKMIIINQDIISHDKNFRDWIFDEFERIKVEIIYVKDMPKPQELFSDKKLSNFRDKIKNIPSLPEIITKSIEIMQDKNASSSALSKIISNDIGLTARVLKLVNSSYYGFPKQISTINQAIIVLGFTTVKGVILSASIYKIFTSKGNQTFDYKNFWKHSLLVATGTKMFAEETNVKTKEDIFSAAFLHDIGKVIFAQYDWDNYINVNKLTYATDKEFMQKEEECCGLNHCEIANLVAYSWNLPEVFCDIITYHHKPQYSEKYKNECSIVYIVNKIVKSIMSKENLNIDNIPLDLLENLHVSGDNINVLYEKLREISDNMNDINSFFD